jgi:hypothetical protein
MSGKEDEEDNNQNSNLCVHSDLLFENILGLFKERKFLEGRKEGPQKDINPLWGLNIGTFWILPPITHSKRLEVRLLG